MISRHIRFHEEDYNALQARIGETVGVTKGIRLLIRDYLRNPEKFQLFSYEKKEG